ncbi:TPA: hypothetical protein UN081_000701 [Stenotrophomonas maltophilia]|nr:hypothetical protein [Stenotrophomonas maltophilia]HEL4848736.1 hypothetical protein [Stenotrophomonas maltophilia]
MNTGKAISTADAVRHLIVCDTLFTWAGVTNLTLEQMMDLQARGWVVEGDDNDEFQLTVAGEEVVARALQHGVPKTLADVQPGGMVRLGDQRSDLVPGIVRCAKCSFQLHRTNLYLQSGTVGAGDSKTEPCPNGCGPLWPVTWETWAREGWAEAERLHLENAALAARQPVGEVSVKKADANNYCLILRALGMEEEGDPVAEVQALIEARDRQPVGEPVAWQSMATCPRDGTAVLLRWGEDHVSPGWWCAAVSPIQNEDGTWPRETGGFPWAFFDMNDGVAFVNHAVDTEYGPTHWAPYVYPAAQAVDLAPDHRGMRVSYSGLLNQVRGGLNSNPELAEMVRQLHGHLNELGKRWYAGDRKVVDEFLQLYVIEDGARRALIDSQAVGK